MDKEVDSEEDDVDILVNNPAFLLPRFNTLRSLAQEQIEYGDIDAAKQSYQKMLMLYDGINKSSLPAGDKQRAYANLMDVFSALSSPETYHKASSIMSIGKYLFPISLVVIVLIIIFFARPQFTLTGLVTADTNSAPQWTGSNAEFTIQGQTQINLDSYFTDPDGDRLTYLVTDAPDIMVSVSGSRLTVTPNPMIKGTRIVSIIASDLEKSTEIVAVLNIK